MMVWPSPATLAEEARRRAVRIRWQKAVGRQIAVNRLAGFATPGTGGLWEEATKKGELRNNAAIMQARRLLDEDPERLVQYVAKMEEERHEAVAARKLHQVVERVERLRLVAEVHTAKTKAAALKAHFTVAKREAEAAKRMVANLRDQAFKAQWRVREAEIQTELVFRKKMALQTTSHKAEMDALRTELCRDEGHWLAAIEFLERQVRDLTALTDFMIKAPVKQMEE